MLVQRRRDTRAALRLMRKLLKKQGFALKLLVTDKLRSYASAFRRLRLTCSHDRGFGGTIEPKIRIRWCDDESAKCSGSNRLARTAFSQHARCRPQHLQPSMPSRLALDAPDLPSRGSEPMAGCDRGRVIAHPASDSFAHQRFFATLTRRRLQRGVFRSLVDLQAAINRYLASTTANPHPSSGPPIPIASSRRSSAGTKRWSGDAFRQNIVQI
jgi:hypothetical protein